MTDVSYTLGEVLHHYQHALSHNPGLQCLGAAQPCPNGRYAVDHEALMPVIYLDLRLRGEGVLSALVDACVELSVVDMCAHMADVEDLADRRAD